MPKKFKNALEKTITIFKKAKQEWDSSVECTIKNNIRFYPN